MNGFLAQHRQRPRSPWWVVIGSGLATAFSAGPMVVSTLSLFVIPITEDTGWSRSAVTAAFTFMSVGQAVGTPIVGHLMDRYTFRRISVPSWALYSVCLALIGTVPRSMPLFYGLYFLAGLFAGGTLIPFMKAVVSWFDNKRGAAVGITAALSALGTTVTPLFVNFLLPGYGWQTTYQWMALIALVVSMAMILGLVRVRAENGVRGRLIEEKPREDAPAEDITGAPELPGLTVREAVRTRSFWLITINLCMTGMAVVGVQVNMVPMLSDQGIPSGQAATLVTLFGVTSLLGRAFGGLLLDHVHAPLACALVMACPIIGVFFLRAPFASAAIGTALIGIAFGVEIDLLPFLVSRYLGMRRFGALLGILQAAIMLLSAFGPPLISLGYELLGSYDTLMYYVAGVLLVCALLVLRLGPYRYPAITGFDDDVACDESAPAAGPAATAAVPAVIAPTGPRKS
ncbi:MFS transporter [Streptomyces sp. NBC_01089]|uniref:MFS transporter n=1 Tax=Streptomyces sp. NBC_01089 TaxID=2903747 RepID=UPI003867D673|nr:MFS transporter [Streptomyces sp. NBC_01089]